MEKLKNTCDVLIKGIFGIAFFLVLLWMFNDSFGIIIAILLLLGTLYIFNRFDVSHKKFLIILLVFSFLIRFTMVVEIKNPQLSDFKTLYDISDDFLDGSLQEKSQHYLNSYNYQIYFVLFQALCLKIVNKIVFLKFINVIISLGCIALMYRIINRITSKSTAQIITVLYAFFINPILYNNILSNQHLFSCLTLLGFDLFFEEKFFKNDILKFSVVGLVIGIANLIRPESIITVVTLGFISVYRLLKKEDSIKDVIKKFIPFLFVYLVITILPSYMLRNDGFVKNEPEIGNLYKVVIGLNSKSNGCWSEEAYNEYINQTDKSQYEISKIKEELCNINLIKLFVKKINIFWNDFGNYWSISYLTNDTLENTKIKTETFKKFIEDYDKVIWIFVCAISLLSIFVSKTDEGKTYFIYLIGAFLMYLIIEVQGRYAFVYRPYMFIVASIGLKNIIDFLKSKKVFEIQKAEYK